MDFELRIDQDKWQFTHFDELIDQFRIEAAHWNNFAAHEPMRVTICKVPNDTETVGIHVSEEIESQDIFGRR